MKHGDLEFHQLTEPLLDSIWQEGLRIARDNHWIGLVIEVTVAARVPGAPAGLRCSLRNTAGAAPEVDEPSIHLLEAARGLQELFVTVGTPFACVTLELIPNQQGQLSRQCRFRYD